MFDCIVVYSPLRTLSAEFIQKLGLLYDRVVLPLPDSIRSDKIDWLNEVAENCTYTQEYLKHLRVLYDSDCEYCRPLEQKEYPALSRSSNVFRSEFFEYIDKNISNNEWEQLLDQAIDCAQDILNFYIARDFLKENPGTRVVFPFSGIGRNNERFTKKMAEILKVAVTTCALHDFSLPDDPKGFRRLVKFSKSIESRYSLINQLEESAKTVEAHGYREQDREELKAVIRQEVLKLVESYNKYIEDLARSSRYIEIKRYEGPNALYLEPRLLQPKPRQKIKEAEIKFTDIAGARIVFNQDTYSIEYERLLLESNELVKKFTEECRWQWDLFTCNLDLEQDLGQIENYRNLSETGFWNYIKDRLPKPFGAKERN